VINSRLDCKTCMVHQEYDEMVDHVYFVVNGTRETRPAWDRPNRNRRAGVSRNCKLRERLHVSYSTFHHQKISSNVIPVGEKSLGVLLIPEVLFPYRGRIRLGSTISDRLKAISEPPFAHWGPTPNINSAVLPGCNLGPPRLIFCLIALSCPRVSTGQRGWKGTERETRMNWGIKQLEWTKWVESLRPINQAQRGWKGTERETKDVLAW
jgi:hypothetical protein